MGGLLRGNRMALARGSKPVPILSFPIWCRASFCWHTILVNYLGCEIEMVPHHTPSCSLLSICGGFTAILPYCHTAIRSACASPVPPGLSPIIWQLSMLQRVTTHVRDGKKGQAIMAHLQFYNVLDTLTLYLLALAKRRIGEPDIGQIASDEYSNGRELNSTLPV